MVDPGKWESKPDLNKFILRPGPITMKAWGSDKLLRAVRWKQNGKWFMTSFIVFWRLRFYVCRLKLDGTRTQWYWQGLLQDPTDPTPDKNLYVFNTNPWERVSIRWRTATPDRERWDNVGGL